MPSQPAWLHRLDEILALLWGFDIGYLDRPAPGRNPAVDPAIRAASPKSAQTGAVISAPVPIPGYRPRKCSIMAHL